jgi:hypothetical protein
MRLIFEKLLLFVLVMLYSLTGLVYSCHSATNLALGKSYTVSPLPSYRLSAPPTDRTSLTDGSYTVGRFWTQKTTVGWHPVRAVEILIDLGEVFTIGSISFSTARGKEAGVFYPAQIATFVGPDKDHLLYVADIADNPDNIEGSYRTKRFILDDIRTKGRYVLLEIVAPKSWSVFCDEIEVLEGNLDSGRKGNLTIEAARNLSERLKWSGIEKKLLQKFLAESKATSDIRNIAAERRTALDQKHTSSGANNHTGAIDSEILATRADVLRSKYPGGRVLIESVNPWAPFTPVDTISGVTPQNLSLAAPRGGYDHTACRITNLSQAPQKISLSYAKMPEGSPEMSLYQVPFVKSAEMEYVADPLIPASGDFNLRPGESGLVFLAARGKAAGVWQTSMEVTVGGIVVSVPVICRVLPVALPENLTLNSVNWGYLSFKLISDRKEQAVKDLFAHHTNVVVVPPAYLQGANQKKLADLLDFYRLESYLKYHQGASKVLLAVGFGTENRTTVVGKHPFLSPGWQDEFRKWYAKAVLAASRAGFDERQVYLYPYDEMAGQQIDDFVRLAVWARKEMPTLKFYATLGEATLNSRGWEKVLPYLDIAQAYSEDMLRSSLKGEAWIYSASGPAKSLSPYAYYRLMSWKAFLRGYRGIGFWAYSDSGWGDNPGTAWDDFDGQYPDFAVVYEGDGNTIISSRRWEAWRMGIEDYELLTMYAKMKGEGAAKALAKLVLDHPVDTSKADEVRRKILIELSETMSN